MTSNTNNVKDQNDIAPDESNALIGTDNAVNPPNAKVYEQYEGLTDQEKAEAKANAAAKQAQLNDSATGNGFNPSPETQNALDTQAAAAGIDPANPVYSAGNDPLATGEARPAIDAAGNTVVTPKASAAAPALIASIDIYKGAGGLYYTNFTQNGTTQPQHYSDDTEQLRGKVDQFLADVMA